MEPQLNFEKRKKVLVTGATGFLGGALVRFLSEKGVGVIAHGRNPLSCDNLRANGYSTLEWDLRDPLRDRDRSMLKDVVTIIHAAALSSPFGSKNDFESVNLLGTNVVLNLAKELGVQRFLFISSPSVHFALKDQLNVSEKDPLPRPFNHYAWSKAEAEKLVLGCSNIGPVILRPRGLYGPGDTTLLPRLLTAAKARALPCFRSGIAKIDLTFIDDAIDAICAALAANSSIHKRTYNISGGQALPVREIVERCCAKANIPVRWRTMRLLPALAVAYASEQLSLLQTEKEPEFTRYGLALFAYKQSLNIQAAQSDLGWSPKISFDEGLERTFTEFER